MTYEIKFTEQGYAWHVYRRIKSVYSGIGKGEEVSQIKIKGLTMTVETDDQKDKVVGLVEKCRMRGVTINELV